MIDYYDINDNELISMSRENNEDAINLLHQKYKPLITKKCSKFYKYAKNKGIEYSVLFQECLIGFEESIKNYNLEDDVTFYTFTNICMDRQLMTEIRRLNRDKYKLLNEAIPLETIEEDSETNMIDFIEDNKDNPELGLIDAAEYQELYTKIIEVLTPFEECVFNLKIDNFDYKEIALILDKEPKSIDNAIQRIKTKIKDLESKQSWMDTKVLVNHHLPTKE